MGYIRNVLEQFKIAEIKQASMAAAATLGPSVPGRGGLSNAGPPVKSPPSELSPTAEAARGKPPPPDLHKAAEVIGHFDSAEGSNIAVVAGPPVKACPGTRPSASTFLFASGSLASGDAVWAQGTLGPGASGAMGSNDTPYKWPGPPVSRGPDLGGVYTPASVAGSVITSFQPPVGLDGKSLVMRMDEDKDRTLQAFPKSAFQ